MRPAHQTLTDNGQNPVNEPARQTEAVKLQAETLNRNAAEVTALGYIGVACVYLMVVALATLFPVPWDDQYTVGLTAAVGIFGLAGWGWMQLHPAKPHQAHPALTLILWLMSAQTGAVLYQIAEPIHSGNQVLIMMATAFFLTARSWFYPTIAFTLLCWMPAALVGIRNEALEVDWNQWARMLLIAAALSVTFFEARRRTVLRNYQLKVRAENALREAQLANAKRLSMQDMMQESQRREALGVLAGGIAHDFNNLLAVISGNLELIAMRDDLDDDAREMLVEVDKASDRAIELTQQMLVYAGRSKPKISNIALGKSIRGAARLIQSSNPANVRITLEGNSDGPLISVDSTLLDQLIINLIQNATEACEPGGGVVRLNWQAKQMTSQELSTLRFSSPPNEGLYAIVEIEDTGTGMDDVTLEKMFEPFYSTKPHGNGLGLAVATGILESHSAGVSVVSEVGKGTALRLAIPAKGASESATAHLASTAQTGAAQTEESANGSH